MEENCCERTRDDAVHTASWSGKADLYKKIAYIKYYNAILMLFMWPKMNELKALATSLAPWH